MPGQAWVNRAVWPVYAWTQPSNRAPGSLRFETAAYAHVGVFRLVPYEVFLFPVAVADSDPTVDKF